MSESQEIDPEITKELQTPYAFETTKVGGKIYDVRKLYEQADMIPTEVVPLSELEKAVSEGQYYWIDKDGQKLGPYQLLQNWEAAQKKSAWADHVETIKRTNPDRAIWINKRDGAVFNGIHRLTRAFLDKRKDIPAKRFDDLSAEAIISEQV